MLISRYVVIQVGGGKIMKSEWIDLILYSVVEKPILST